MPYHSVIHANPLLPLRLQYSMAWLLYCRLVTPLWYGFALPLTYSRAVHLAYSMQIHMAHRVAIFSAYTIAILSTQYGMPTHSAALHVVKNLSVASHSNTTCESYCTTSVEHDSSVAINRNVRAQHMAGISPQCHVGFKLSPPAPSCFVPLIIGPPAQVLQRWREHLRYMVLHNGARLARGKSTENSHMQLLCSLQSNVDCPVLSFLWVVVTCARRVPHSCGNACQRRD